MSAVVRTVKNEIQALIAVRKNSTYPSIGRMVWGKHWYLYILMILIIQNIVASVQGLLFMSMMKNPGPYYNYIAVGFSLLDGIIPFFLAILIWGVLPFTRHNAKEAVDGLLRGGITRFTIYRAFVLHTLGAYFYFYVAKILVNNARGYLWNVLFQGTVPHHFWQSLAPHSYALSINPDGYEGFLPLRFYRVIVCPLWDLMGHVPYYINTCLFPVLAIVFLMAYWKRKDVYFVIRRLIYISLFVWFLGLIFSGPIYLLIATDRLELYAKIQSYYLFAFQTFMWFVWGLIFWRVFRKVTKIAPFSEEPQN